MVHMAGLEIAEVQDTSEAVAMTVEKVFVGRLKGVKGAKTHLFGTRWEVTGRLCDWLGPAKKDIEEVPGPPTCKHCLGIQRGKRPVALSTWV